MSIEDYRALHLARRYHFPVVVTINVLAVDRTRHAPLQLRALHFALELLRAEHTAVVAGQFAVLLDEREFRLACSCVTFDAKIPLPCDLNALQLLDSDVFELHGHRGTGVQLKCKQARFGSFGGVIIRDFARHPAVDDMHHTIAASDDFVVVPVFLLDDFVDVGRLADCRDNIDLGLVFACRNVGHLPTLRQDTSTSLFVQDSRIRIARFKISLVTTDDPVRTFLAAILNARVTTDDLEFQSKLKIVDRPTSPDDERVAFRRLVLGGDTGDRSILHRPELRIPIPPVQRFAIEDGNKTFFVMVRMHVGHADSNQQQDSKSATHDKAPSREDMLEALGYPQAESFSTLLPTNQSARDARMSGFKSFVDEFHRHYSRCPNIRAQLGIEDRLDELPDPSIAALQTRLDEARHLLRQIPDIRDKEELNDDQQLDVDLAELMLQAEVHRGTYKFNSRLELQQLPNAGAEIGDGIFTMFLVDPRPDALRLADILGRIQRIPAYLSSMLGRLEKPVARWVTMDLECLAELHTLFASVQDWASAVGWGQQSELTTACEAAIESVERYCEQLRQLPTTDDFHLGDENARELVRLSGIDLSLEELHEIARDYLAEVSEAIESSRSKLVAKYSLPSDMSADELHSWLNRKYAVDVDVSQNDFSPILKRYEQEREKIRSFIQERDLFPILEDEDMRIIQTPEFMVPLIPAGAMTGPAAFRSGTRISQVFLTLTEDRLDDHTELGIPIMMVHEGIPGHHLHLATGRTHDSVVRRHIYASDQAEGWTTMLEDYMLDQGYMGELTEEARFSGKRDISRIGARVAIDLFFMTGDRKYLDVGIHCDTSSADPFRAAAELLKAVTGFSEARAQAELNWYSTERGIPLTYLTGNRLVWQLKDEVAQWCGQRNPPLAGLALDREFHRVFLEMGLMPVRFARTVFQRRGLLPG